jgi:hypothetical protein
MARLRPCYDRASQAKFLFHGGEIYPQEVIPGVPIDGEIFPHTYLEEVVRKRDNKADPYLDLLTGLEIQEREVQPEAKLIQQTPLALHIPAGVADPGAQAAGVISKPLHGKEGEGDVSAQPMLPDWYVSFAHMGVSGFIINSDV